MGRQLKRSPRYTFYDAVVAFRDINTVLYPDDTLAAINYILSANYDHELQRAYS